MNFKNTFILIIELENIYLALVSEEILYNINHKNVKSHEQVCSNI